MFFRGLLPFLRGYETEGPPQTLKLAHGSPKVAFLLRFWPSALDSLEDLRRATRQGDRQIRLKLQVGCLEELKSFR